MSAPIRTLVAIDPAVAGAHVDAALDDPGIRVVASLEATAGAELGADIQSDVLLVVCEGHSDGVVPFVADSVNTWPDRPVVVACLSTPNGIVPRVFESGADDVVLLAESPNPGADTFFALQKALARRSGGPGEADAGGAVITVLGPKGGTGKTLSATNLAVALAEAGQRVAAVDLDLQFGDLGLAMGIPPERTIYDLMTSGGSLDADKVEAYLSRHDSGARVLLAPSRPDQASAITVDFLGELFGLLRARNDFVVVDTPPNFTPEVIASIDASSSVLVVCMLDALSIKNTRLGLETLELMGYPSERVRILLNRADTNVGISPGDVTDILGRASDVLVPSQREITRSVNRGDPIVRSSARSEPAKAYRALAARYVTDRAGSRTTKRGGLGRRLLGRA